MNAYLILDLGIHDLASFMDYVREIPDYIAKHSGRYVVQGVVPTVIEGDWEPERLVVIEFPSREKARTFLTDPDVQPLFGIRHRTTTSKLLLVDGCLDT